MRRKAAILRCVLCQQLVGAKRGQLVDVTSLRPHLPTCSGVVVMSEKVVRDLRRMSGGLERPTFEQVRASYRAAMRRIDAVLEPVPEEEVDSDHRAGRREGRARYGGFRR